MFYVLNILCLFILSGWIAGAGWFAVAWTEQLKPRGWSQIIYVALAALLWPWWLPAATAWEAVVGERRRREAWEKTMRAFRGKANGSTKAGAEKGAAEEQGK